MTTTKQLADKAINIKGKDYIQVKDRIQFLAENYEGRYNLQSEYQYFDSRKMWVVKATLTIWDEEHKEFSVYNWLAQEIETEKFWTVNFSSALENAETSAWGRACAAAWIGIDATWGIASANEMEKALNRSKVAEKIAADTPFVDSWVSNAAPTIAAAPWEPEWFTKAKQGTKFMLECLDEEDYIAKIKARVKEIGAKINKQQETDLRICYNNAKWIANLQNMFTE